MSEIESPGATPHHIGQTGHGSHIRYSVEKAATIYRGNRHQVGSSVTRETSSLGMSFIAPQFKEHHKGKCFSLIN